MLRETRGLFGLASSHPALLRSLRREASGGPGDEAEQQEARAVEAAVEIGRRLAGAAVDRSDPLRNLEALAAYLALRHFRRDQEVVGALYLDGKGRWLAEEPVFLGTLHRTRFEPRQFLAHALVLAGEEATPIGIVLFHTHPSEDPTPSREDVQYTRRMAVACEAVGVELVDHLVLGSPRRWVSMRRREVW